MDLTFILMISVMIFILAFVITGLFELGYEGTNVVLAIFIMIFQLLIKIINKLASVYLSFFYITVPATLIFVFGIVTYGYNIMGLEGSPWDVFWNTWGVLISVMWDIFGNIWNNIFN